LVYLIPKVELVFANHLNLSKEFLIQNHKLVLQNKVKKNNKYYLFHSKEL